MADIKGLQIFGATNKGLDKMKAQVEKTDTEKKNSSKEKKIVENKPPKKESTPKKKAESTKKVPQTNNVPIAAKTTKTKTEANKKLAQNRSAGAPIRKFDRVYATKQPLKLSPILNSTSRILVEKYLTNMSRDELLRQALNSYIKQNLSQEDKLDLFNDLIKDLELFRSSKLENETVAEVDDSGAIIRSTDEIEQETEADIIQSWGINKK